MDVERQGQDPAMTSDGRHLDLGRAVRYAFQRSFDVRLAPVSPEYTEHPEPTDRPGTLVGGADDHLDDGPNEVQPEPESEFLAKLREINDQLNTARDPTAFSRLLAGREALIKQELGRRSAEAYRAILIAANDAQGELAESHPEGMRVLGVAYGRIKQGFNHMAATFETIRANEDLSSEEAALVARRLAPEVLKRLGEKVGSEKGMYVIHDVLPLVDEHIVDPKGRLAARTALDSLWLIKSKEYLDNNAPTPLTVGHVLRCIGQFSTETNRPLIKAVLETTIFDKAHMLMSQQGGGMQEAKEYVEVCSDLLDPTFLERTKEVLELEEEPEEQEDG